ncbi:MAG: LPP20 family lipoprotein [Treponema sp.]|nr:LPP20 family lipoprotein [Treponema sp.]
MQKFKIMVVFILTVMIVACASAPAAQSAPVTDNSASQAQGAAQAQAQAMDALNRMDGGGGLPSAGGGGAQQPAQPQQPGQSAPAAPNSGTVVNTSRTQPGWVNNAESTYPRSQFVAAVGHGGSRDLAERQALANLTAVFGQAIQADTTITNTYQEAIRSGAVTGWSDDIAMQNTIRTSASMDTLVGAEIREVWFDTKSTHYAVAVMDRARTARTYTDMILANQNMINNLTNMSAAEKNSIEGYSRYQFAATVADINGTYVNVLNYLGAQPPAGIQSGNTYRLEAQNIVRAIPVGIRVTNDKSNRVQGAFAKSFSDLGFRSGGTNSRYILNVNIVISPVELPNNPNQFVRIELGADLTDTTSGSVLLPFNFSSREGHTNVSEAENRAFMAAERKIAAEYKDLLSGYLNTLLPQR